MTKYNLKGGDNSNIGINKQSELFLSIIILGYFGIKIVYGVFFGFYPNKFYYRNIEVTTNESGEASTTSAITLNAYVPGIWNNEMTDFITLLVLAYVVFIYTNVTTKSFIASDGNINMGFLFGYIIGLGYPVIYSNYIELYKEQISTSNMIQVIYLIVLLSFIVLIIVLNFSALKGDINTTNQINYVIYCIVIVLLFFGLIFGRKMSENYNSVRYFYNDGQNCTFNKYGVIQTSGENINITIPFLVFIMLLLFSYEPGEITMKNLYIFIFGLLLGILVSSISYYGIEYFLQKQPQKECSDPSECILKSMPLPVYESASPSEDEENAMEINTQNMIVDSNLSDENKNKTVNNTTSLLKIILLILLILAAIYLIFFYILKPIFFRKSN